LRRAPQAQTRFKDFRKYKKYKKYEGKYEYV